MSALYGTLSGDGRAGTRTRCASRETTAAARSWEGSVTVSIERCSNGDHIATLLAADGSAVGGRQLWRGPLSLLIAAKRLDIFGDMREPAVARG